MADEAKNLHQRMAEVMKSVIGVGGRTSTMSKRVFCDLVTLIYSFGDQRGVEWSDPRQDAEEMWRSISARQGGGVIGPTQSH